MTLYDYIALNNPNDANQLLTNYGFDMSKSYETISERLKAIVRKYKKVALQDISFIHPDKKLLNSFTTSNVPEAEFSYANGMSTGRTPGFVEAPIEKDNFKDERDIQMKETQKLLDEIKAVKKQAQYEKERRNSSNMHSNIGQMQLSQNNMLMLVVVFAIGYMIGNK